jgi:polyhydroxybutyrate depolymerase
MSTRHPSSAVHVEHSAISVGGVRRRFTTLGARTAPRPRPLIVVFHGSRQTAASHRRFTGGTLDRLAMSGDAVVTYLDGYRGHWNDARRESFFSARLKNMNDVAFTRVVAEEIAITHGTDPARTIAVGYSNGGQMVLRLLHEVPDLIAGAVIIAATMPARENFLTTDAPPTARPAAITLVHGTHDRIAPFEGGTMSRSARLLFKVGGRFLSAPDTAAYLARRNGITAAPTSQLIQPRARSRRRTAATRIQYRQASVPPVTLYEIHGGGHTVPGPHAAPRLLGRTSVDVTLAELVSDALADLPPSSGTLDSSPLSAPGETDLRLSN